jgi:hypothetical protein
MCNLPWYGCRYVHLGEIPVLEGKPSICALDITGKENFIELCGWPLKYREWNVDGKGKGFCDFVN